MYRRLWFERDVLSALNHPLLPSLKGFVSTEKIVGFMIERCSGGDLNSLRRRQTEKMFSDSVIRYDTVKLLPLTVSLFHKMNATMFLAYLLSFGNLKNHAFKILFLDKN